MQLSPHFALSELTRSSTGIPNDPDLQALHHLADLCRDVLEPVRALLGVPLKVNSGYRSGAVNRAIGGSKTSQHMQGQAADVVPVGMDAEEAMKLIAEAVRAGSLPHLGQAIVYASGFLHLSIDTEKPRQHLLRSASRGGSGGPYMPYTSS